MTNFIGSISLFQPGNPCHLLLSFFFFFYFPFNSPAAPFFPSSSSSSLDLLISSHTSSSVPSSSLHLLISSHTSSFAIVTTGAGLNHLYLPECRRRGIKIANVGDVFSADGADYAIGLLIDVLQRISGGDRHVKDGF
ncbi:Glyoxylate/hydroxypyruvate reductase HPR3 [Linum perenne]